MVSRNPTAAAAFWSAYSLAVLAVILSCWPTSSCKAGELEVKPGDTCILPTTQGHDGRYSPDVVTVMHLAAVNTSGRPGAWVSLAGSKPEVWRLVHLTDLVGCHA